MRIERDEELSGGSLGGEVWAGQRPVLRFEEWGWVASVLGGQEGAGGGELYVNGQRACWDGGGAIPSAC